MIRRYHDGTKHHFHRFARSLGYLDWASQPDPFRAFVGAPQVWLPPHPAAPASADPVGSILRHALGLTAWKAFRGTRWSLRANPSSGNLHPTEAYVVCGPAAGSDIGSAVHHYAPDRHALERRCAFDGAAWPGEALLIALTSIHWREAWKYGERAFRYCQHDLGHAIAAVSFAARLAGWQAALLPDWSHADIAAVTGTDRAADYADAEREEPGAILAVARDHAPVPDREQLVAAVAAAAWTGRASRLSEHHVQWTLIDEVATATRDEGRARAPLASRASSPSGDRAQPYPREILLARRSAVAFDGRSSMAAGDFFTVLGRTLPDGRAPWDAVWWSPRIHLALFVHRVDDLDPGLYLLLRDPESGERLVAALGRAFQVERVIDHLPLFVLARGDCRALARRLSCDQEIASDGFFSLGMIAEFDRSLAEYGGSFYRHLFWESGIVGQTLYLEAEAAGARATGIGCFYDDPVHEVLGLQGHAFQSLYHFTVGMPIEDVRLTTSPGYPWEKAMAPRVVLRA